MSDKNKLYKKIKEEHPQFAEEVSSLSVSDLDSRIAQLSKDLEAVSEAKDNDDDLKSVYADYKEKAAPYSEAKKAVKIKIKYIIALIKEKQ